VYRLGRFLPAAKLVSHCTITDGQIDPDPATCAHESLGFEGTEGISFDIDPVEGGASAALPFQLVVLTDATC
jgi:hypothetical protein